MSDPNITKSAAAPHGVERKSSRLPPWLTPAMMVALFLLAFGLILWLTHQNAENGKQRELQLKTESLAERLRLRLKGNLDYLQMLAVARSTGKLTPARFQERATQYVRYHQELINVTWVDAGYFIRGVAPLPRNREIIGLRLDLPEPKRASHLATQLRSPVYTRPFDAIQGGSSFEVWLPVFNGETFLGLFAGVYSCERLLDLLASEEQRQLYQVSLIDGSGAPLAGLPVSASLDHFHVETVALTTPEAGIFLRTERYLQKGQDWRITLLGLLSLGLVVGMALALWRLRVEIEERRRTEEAIQEQAAHLELEVEERQMAQENLQEQAVQLEEEISERRQVEEALLASEERLRLILDSTGEAICGIDLDGRCSFSNNACIEMLGYSNPDELLGKDMHLTVHHSHTDGTNILKESCRIWEATNAGEGTHVDDEVFWRRDGTCFAVEYWSYPQLKDEKVVGSVVTFINITQRKELEEQFRQAQKMESIGRLAGGVAHDFNNMLSVIIGAAELSKCKIADGESALPYLELISKAAGRSSEITRQLLAFSRKEVVSPKPVNLNAQIIESEKMLGRLISEDVKLSFRPATDLWSVMIDPSQVDQILMNLAANASDAMPDGGSLTLETANVQLDYNFGSCHANAKAGDYVLLTVTDTGMGMERSTVEHIFEPFFTTKGVGKGTGLGLATVYGIVTQNNGFINVFSEPGDGSLFKIYFPRLNDQVSPEERREPTNASAAGTVVLVEDEDMVLWMATKLLEEMGFQVIQAQTPEKALTICADHEQQIDLVLSDVVMPGMNGKEMYDRIRRLRPGLKVLFMSGYSEDIVAQRGVVEQGMHYIEKPLEMNKLYQKIRQVLAEG
jgi:two-component system, cell cycle sensor histidine kinase and response regulator CckA